MVQHSLHEKPPSFLILWLVDEPYERIFGTCRMFGAISGIPKHWRPVISSCEGLLNEWPYLEWVSQSLEWLSVRSATISPKWHRVSMAPSRNGDIACLGRQHTKMIFVWFSMPSGDHLVGCRAGCRPGSDSSSSRVCLLRPPTRVCLWRWWGFSSTQKGCSDGVSDALRIRGWLVRLRDYFRSKWVGGCYTWWNSLTALSFLQVQCHDWMMSSVFSCDLVCHQQGVAKDCDFFYPKDHGRLLVLPTGPCTRLH